MLREFLGLHHYSTTAAGQDPAVTHQLRWWLCYHSKLRLKV